MELEQIESLKTALEIRLDDKKEAVNILNSISILHDIFVEIDSKIHKISNVKINFADDIIIEINKD